MHVGMKVYAKDTIPYIKEHGPTNEWEPVEVGVVTEVYEASEHWTEPCAEIHWEGCKHPLFTRLVHVDLGRSNNEGDDE